MVANQYDEVSLIHVSLTSPVKVLTNESSVVCTAPARPSGWGPFASCSLTLPGALFPVQRAGPQGNPGQHDTRDRESEAEPGAAEHSKLSLISPVYSNFTSLILHDAL